MRGHKSYCFLLFLLILCGRMLVPTAIHAAPDPSDGESDPWRTLKPASVDSVFSLFRAVADSSPNVIWVDHGRSHGGHQLGYAVVARPEHLARLTDIQSDIDRLGDPRKRAPKQLLKNLPAVVWLTFSVHGHELAPADAACRLVTLLASDSSMTASTIRDSLIVLIDPLRNPDGRDRALAQRRRWLSRQPVYDDHSYHHKEIWPSSRGNHYFFDLNRDAWRLSQPEAKSRAQDIVLWQPQVVVDLHEMRAYDTYLFSPPRLPSATFISQTVGEWWDRFSRAIAETMTSSGIEYYRGDWHEAFAPNRLVSWSLRTGATGILLEVPGVDGTAVQRPDGTVLYFEETVDRHFAATMSILETAAFHRTGLLKDFHSYRKYVVSGKHLSQDGGRIPLCGAIENRVEWLARNENVEPDGADLFLSSGQENTGNSEQCQSLTGGRMRSVLFPPSRNESRRLLVAEILLRQGVEVGAIEIPFRAHRAKNQKGQPRGGRLFPAGTFVVDLHQPLGGLAASLLEIVPAMEEIALLEERRSLVEEGKSTLYQYSTWSLPLWADVDTWYARNRPNAKLLKLDSLRLEPGAGGTGTQTSQQLIDDWENSHAFLLDAADDATLVAALHLLKREVNLLVTSTDFEVKGRAFAPGSVIIPTHDGVSGKDVVDACLRAGAEPVAVELGLMDRGTDLGSRKIVPAIMPRIAILSGFGTSAMAVGSLWHLFDQEMDWPVSLLPIQRITRANLTDYNVLVLPDSPEERGRRLREIIGGDGWDRLLNWVSLGGTLVLCGESIGTIPTGDEEAMVHIGLRREWLEQVPRLGQLVIREMSSKALLQQGFRSINTGMEAEDSFGTIGPQLDSPLRQIWAQPVFGLPEEAEAWDEQLRRFSPRGVFMHLDAAREHWLCSGLSEEPTIPVKTKQAYHTTSPAAAILRFALEKNLCASGLLWPEARHRWEGTAALIQEKVNSGQVIGIAGDFKHGSPVLERLVLNAVILGPTFAGR